MKGYENVYRMHLVPWLPTIVRVDGRHFHTFTKKMKYKKPFDEWLVNTMDKTAIALCKDVMNVRMAYVQSDEISLVLVQGSPDSQAWFDGNILKIASVAASVATQAFNADLPREFAHAQFDARCFVLPPHDVAAYFRWRQADWERNSVQMLARSLYSHKEIDGKDKAAMHDLIHAKGQNWNDLPTHLRRGRCVVKKTAAEYVENPHFKGTVDRSRWVVDTEIPIFSQNPEYIVSKIMEVVSGGK